MQYDLKDLEKTQFVSVSWHGEPTRVLLDGKDEKTVVNKGDVLKVSVDQAQRLLKYSDLWTLEGDKPTEQPWRKAQAEAAKAADARGRRASKGEEAKAVPAALTEADVDAMETKEEVLAALKAKKVKVNSNASLDELKSVLKESMTPEESKTEEPAAESAPEADEKKDESQPKKKSGK